MRLKSKGQISFDTRKTLSSGAFGHTAQYDSIIHNYVKDEAFPNDLSITFKKHSEMRYGENPHQSAAAYKIPGYSNNNILNAADYGVPQIRKRMILVIWYPHISGFFLVPQICDEIENTTCIQHAFLHFGEST